MAQNAANKAPEATKPEVTEATEVPTMKDFNRTIQIVKTEMSSIFADANRKTPWFSKTQEEAQAKAVAASKSFGEFIAMARSLKDNG